MGHSEEVGSQALGDPGSSYLMMCELSLAFFFIVSMSVICKWRSLTCQAAAYA